MIIHNPILTGSFTVNGTDVASITSSAASITAINSYTASQNILNGTYATTGSNTFKNPQTINSNLIVTGSITAQTLVVQTVSSSVIYSSGSNVFGNDIANTQVMTGSVTVTGSLAVVTNGTEFQVGATGVNFGNALTDSHVISGSVRINPSGLFISSSGNIGIGTILPNAYSGYTTLTINNTTTGAVLDLNRSGTRTGTFYADTSGVGIGSLIATNLDIFTGNSYINFQTSGSERMRITAAGNVLIGQTNDRLLLNVGGDVALINNSTYSTSLTRSITYYSSTISYSLQPIANINFLTQGDAVSAMTFTTRSSPADYAERMRITPSGDVLVGTTSSPSSYGKVTIKGTNSGLTIQDAATNNYRAIYSQSGTLYFYNGTNEGYLSSGGTWVNASDVTLKKDVKEIEYGLKEVMELKPKWYRMIEDDLEQIGFIAQDVEEILPELVSTSERGMKGLSYGQLTAVLVKAIQELQAQITELKNK